MSTAFATPARDAVPYEEHRGYVLAVLARRCGWLDVGEREAVFHDAYVVLLQKQSQGELDTDGMHPRRLRAYIVQTALNKALDEGKRAERRRSEPIGERALAAPDAGPGLEEVASASLDNARLREVVAGLPARQQTVVKLRFYFDRAPDEIQDLLGISERTYRRELERALRQVAEGYALVRDGRFCDRRRSLILAYVAGIAGPNRAREAADHLASCPACTRWAADLREAARHASALLPLPAIVTPSGLERLRTAVEVARNGASELVTGAKQHAAGAVSRLDPSGAGYTLSARPGAATAAVIGCLALGGGATYCVVEGLPGLRDRAPQRQAVAQPQRTKERPAAAAEPKQARPAPTAAAAVRRSDPAAAAIKPERRSTPEVAPATQEFGLEGSAEAVAGGTGAPSASQPAQPAQPPGEFDP